MKLCLRIGSITLLTLTLAMAGSTKFISTWKNPNAGPVGGANKRVAAFVISPDPSMRLGPEETLATELRERGIDCIAGYTVLPGELAKDKEKAKQFLQEAGITGAVLMRVVERGEEVSWVAGSAWYAGPYYPSFWGYWDHSWSTVYSPGYMKTNEVISIETLIYSVEEDMLLWAGRSKSTNPKNVRKFVKQLVDKAGKRMRKDGLVRLPE